MIQPKISVIVAVYQAEAYLHRCIDSLLAQTFHNYEILLIDDGSPDHSGEICDEYAKINPRIRVFHKPNEGVSATRQFAINHAWGEYTIHADPDDWVEPTMLEELYEKAKKEDADMVICDFYVDKENKKQIYQRQEPSSLNHKKVLHELFQQLHGSCCNKLVRRVCYNKYNVSFPTAINYKEDLCFFVQLLMHPIKISYLSRAFYHYVRYVNENSISDSNPKEMLKVQLAYIDFIEQLLKAEYPECITMAKVDIKCWVAENNVVPFSHYKQLYPDITYLGCKNSISKGKKIKFVVSESGCWWLLKCFRICINLKRFFDNDGR